MRRVGLFLLIGLGLLFLHNVWHNNNVRQLGLGDSALYTLKKWIALPGELLGGLRRLA